MEATVDLIIEIRQAIKNVEARYGRLSLVQVLDALDHVKNYGLQLQVGGKFKDYIPLESKNSKRGDEL